MNRLIIFAISGIMMISCMSPEEQACFNECRKLELSESDTLDVVEKRHYSEMEYSYGFRYDGKMGWRHRLEPRTTVILSNGDSTTFDFHTECQKVIKKPKYLPKKQGKNYKPQFLHWNFHPLK